MLKGLNLQVHGGEKVSYQLYVFARTLLWASCDNHGVEDRVYKHACPSGRNLLQLALQEAVMTTMLSVCQHPPGWKQWDRLHGTFWSFQKRLATGYCTPWRRHQRKWQKFSDKNAFLKQCRWEKEFQLFQFSGFPCEIFGMGGNDVLCFLNQEIVLCSGRFISSCFTWRFWGLCAGDRTITVGKSST